MKKIVKMVMVFALLVVSSPVFVNAATQTQPKSTLTLPADQQFSGSKRDYIYPNQQIDISADSVGQPTQPKKIVISLNKSTLLGSTQQARKTVSFSLSTCFLTVMGNHGTGTKFFAFGSYENALKEGSSGHGMVYSGLNSSSVLMSSYN